MWDEKRGGVVRGREYAPSPLLCGGVLVTILGRELLQMLDTIQGKLND